MTPKMISLESAPPLDWTGAVEALRRGHTLPRAEIGDIFLGPSDGTLLTRAAHVPGLGYGVKAVTVLPANPARGLSTVQGAMTVFDGETGTPRAVIESGLVTLYKTAADSVLGAVLLARPEAKRLLIVGAGSVGRSLVDAYPALFPGLERIDIWARRSEQAQALIDSVPDPMCPLFAASDLAGAAGAADIIASATMAREPVLKGAWIAPGTHVDLIGAFKADMREADDALITGGRLCVDSRDSTIGHIGELAIPISQGTITEAQVLADLYDLVADPARGRHSVDDVTIFKNGGGAHLDVMIADWIAHASEAA